MNKDFSELIEYLDDKFEQLDKTKADKEDVREIMDFFEQIDEKKADKSEICDLHDVIDAYAKKVDIYSQEMILSNHRVNIIEGRTDKIENWTHQIADKVGVKLEK